MDIYRMARTRGDVGSSSSGDSNSEDDDDELSWKRRAIVAKSGQLLGSDSKIEKPSVMDVDFKPALYQKNSEAQPCKRTPNNVWAAVLQERVLTEDLNLVGIGHRYRKNGDRNVESYNYKRRELGTETDSNSSDEDDDSSNPVMEDEPSKPQEQEAKTLGKKRTLKDRLGTRAMDLAEDDVLKLATETEIKTAKEIAEKLNEPKYELMCRVVHFVGEEKASKLLHLTEDVEEAGGMMTLDGSRRRTAGGVFFQLLKSDAHVTKEITDQIFHFERIQQELKKRQLRKAHRRLRLKGKQKQGDAVKEKPEDNMEENAVPAEAIKVATEPVIPNVPAESAKGAESEMEEGEIVD